MLIIINIIGLLPYFVFENHSIGLLPYFVNYSKFTNGPIIACPVLATIIPGHNVYYYSLILLLLSTLKILGFQIEIENHDKKFKYVNKDRK